MRTHFYPAWSASAAGQDVPLRADQDQLAFDAPAGGDVVVQLSYDRRTWLTILSIATLLVGMAALTRVGSA